MPGDASHCAAQRRQGFIQDVALVMYRWNYCYFKLRLKSRKLCCHHRKKIWLILNCNLLTSLHMLDIQWPQTKKSFSGRRSQKLPPWVATLSISNCAFTWKNVDSAAEIINRYGETEWTIGLCWILCALTFYSALFLNVIQIYRLTTWLWVQEGRKQSCRRVRSVYFERTSHSVIKVN